MILKKSLKEKWKEVPLGLKVSASFTICSIVQKSISLITMPLFTRLLTTEQYGQATIYNSWLSIFSIFLTLNLAYGSFSTAMVKFENRRNEYITSVQGICLLLCTVFLIIYLPIKAYWNKLFDMSTALVVVMVFDILTQTAVLLWSGKKRFEFKYKSVIIVTLLITILSPIISYIFVMISTEKGDAKIIGGASVGILFGAIIFCFNRLKGKKFFDIEYWKYALGFNIPLLAYYLSQVVFNQSDRIMINHLVGKSEAAIYGVAYNLAMILTFVLNAINSAYVPWFYERIKEGKETENRKISCIIAILLALMLLCVIWYAPEIIYVMAGEAYVMATYVVAPVAMSLLLLFYSQLFINVEFYFEEKKSLVFASIGAAVVNIILNALLIPIRGFVVAGYTTLLSYLLFVICNYLSMKKVLRKKKKEDIAYNYKYLILICSLFIIIGFCGVALYNFWVIRCIITIFVCVSILVNWKKFKIYLGR